MRILPLIHAVALVACASTEPEPARNAATQYIGEDRDTGEPWYPDTGGDGNDGDDSDDNDGQMECRTVTISGRVFYNDLRSTGRFTDRYTPSDTQGVGEPWNTGDNRNYLGLRDAVIDFYEVDDTTSGEGCVQTDAVGGVTIDKYGDYTWTGQVCDACDADHDGANDNGVSLAGRIRLRFCNSDRCFSVRDPLGMPATGTAHFADTFVVADPYRRWLRGASLTAPRIFAASTTATLADDYFQASASQTAGVATDLYAQAASVYASLVDTTRVLHYTHGVPYDKDTFGEVQVFYPSVIGGDGGGGAHSHQPEDKETSRFCIESTMASSTASYAARTPGAWYEGDSAAHEYGHLVHYWQWDGFGKWTSYCYEDAACDSGGAPEYVLAALKEGWAKFIASVVWNDIGNGWGDGCDNQESRSPDGSPYLAPPQIPSLRTVGRRWYDDVETALCDLWDGAEDSASYGLVVYRDRAVTPLPTMVAHLRSLWLDATEPQRDEIRDATSFGPSNTATTPIGICELVALRNDALWVEALKVTGIDCGL